MRAAILLLAAPILLTAQTAADPAVRGGGVEWFQLAETMDEIEKRLGPPHVRAPFGKGLESWQYRLGHGDGHEPSHYFVFTVADRRLRSVTRNFDPEERVDHLLPPNASKFATMPSNPAFGIRIRRLPGGRVLLAIGADKPDRPVSQLVLMPESRLLDQYPWMAGR